MWNALIPDRRDPRHLRQTLQKMPPLVAQNPLAQDRGSAGISPNPHWADNQREPQFSDRLVAVLGRASDPLPTQSSAANGGLDRGVRFGPNLSVERGPLANSSLALVARGAARGPSSQAPGPASSLPSVPRLLGECRPPFGCGAWRRRTNL